MLFSGWLSRGRRYRLPWALVLINGAACASFVVLREPASSEYLAEVDAVRRTGGVHLNSAIDGTLACRHLYSWSEWHGGEVLGVKLLEVANAPALAVTGVFDAAGTLGVARAFSLCTWSWLLAAVILVAASIQWWLVGTASRTIFTYIRERSRQD